MLSKEKIDRINALARKSKSECLTPEEKEEQAGTKKRVSRKISGTFQGSSGLDSVCR